MSKTWWLVIIASLFEVMWVIGLKHADNWLTWLITVLSITISFAALIYSSKKLPTSTVYAVFVGLGTAGTVVSEMIWFNEAFSWLKIILILLLLTGIIGLKFVSPEENEKEGKVA